jgi:AraC-like DNA-binding protein
MSTLIFLASNNHPINIQFIDKHLLGYYTIQFVCQGDLEVVYDERIFALNNRPGGWFFPAYPGPRFRFHPQRPRGTWWHRHIAFQGELVERWRAVGLWPTEPQPAPEGMDGGEQLDAIVALSQQTGRWSREKAVNQLEALLLDLAEAREAPARESSWLSGLLAQLSETFSPDYPCLAQEHGWSVATLRRRFKAETGQNIHDYVIAQRIARARALLAQSDLPLREIASQLGYDSEFFFARQFKQVAQVTPGEYRRSRLFIPPTG